MFFFWKNYEKQIDLADAVDNSSTPAVEDNVLPPQHCPKCEWTKLEYKIQSKERTPKCRRILEAKKESITGPVWYIWYKAKGSL